MTEYIIIFLLLLAAELIYFRIADKCNIIDKPNERSSHKSIVLRGGGIIYLLGMWLYAAFFGVELWPFLLGITLVAGISFVDDIHSLPDSLRLVFQFASMFLMFYGWGILNLESWWIIILGLILCVGITNVYNFMDGINGINGGYTLALLLPLAWLNHQMGFVDQKRTWVTGQCLAGSGGGSLIRFEVKPKIGRKVHKSEGKVQKWQKNGIKIAMD